MRVDIVTSEVVEALRSAGIRSILLKGPATARLLYDGRTQRSYGDADLLVPPPEGLVETVLGRHGFRLYLEPIPHDSPKHSVAWTREDDGACVDVHRTFFGVGVSDEKAWEVLSRQTEPMLVGGAEVEVLSPPARALVITLHTASHGRPWTKGLEDLARALARLNLETWEAAAHLADELEATVAFGAGLRLLPEGEPLAEQLGLPRESSVVLSIRMSGGPPSAHSLERFLSLRGWAKLLFAARKVVPSRRWLRAWAAQDSRRPSNLALAYLYRLGYVARMAPLAFRTWRSARNEVRGEQ